MTIGDVVRIKKTGEIGVIDRDRLNGMVDVALAMKDGSLPRLGEGIYYECRGTRECLYKDELESVEVRS